MTKKTKNKCKCPFCETELLMKCVEPVFCKPCGLAFHVCPGCGELFNSKLGSCPKCSSKK